MNEQAQIHVSQTGDNWEVETTAGTVAQAETKQEAIEAAREAAPEMKAETIVVHTGDGSVETEINLPAESSKTAGAKE